MIMLASWVWTATILSVLFWAEPVHGEGKVVQHTCMATDNPNEVLVRFKVIQNDDPILSIYAYEAENVDTTDETKRIDDCTVAPNVNGDPYTDVLLIERTFDVTNVTHECGAYIETITDTSTKVVKLVFHLFGSSTDMVSWQDETYLVSCRTDQLMDIAIDTGETTGDITATVRKPVTLMSAQNGLFLRIRDARTHFPLAAVTVALEVYMTVEFIPEYEYGPDNYGDHFFFGFLGNDPVLQNIQQSSSFLKAIVLPKYDLETHIRVTISTGDDVIVREQATTDRTPVTFTFDQSLMGCSNGGDAEFSNKGVEIESFDLEIAVLVCNIEVDSTDCYRALPTDVTGSEYYLASADATEDSPEMMIIATEDNTDIELTVPSSSDATITVNSTSLVAGSSVTFTLNKRETFHYALVSASSQSLTGFKVVSTNNKPISVINGNRYHSSDHLSEQMPSVDTVGKSYVLIPANPNGDGRLTTYIVQRVETDSTVVTVYLSGSAKNVYTLDAANPSVKFDIDDVPRELTADKRVLVTMFMNPPNNSATYEPSMVVLPAVTQWAPVYGDYSEDNTRVAVVFKSAASRAKFMVDSSAATLDTWDQNVYGPSGYVYAEAAVPGDSVHRFYLDNPYPIRDTFMAVLFYLATDSGGVYLPVGYRYNVLGYCPTYGQRGDLFDNDCDGEIDEELNNGIDDDGDGDIDEDSTISSKEFTGLVNIRPTNCKVSGFTDFVGGSKTHQLTDASGCIDNSTAGPFIWDSEFEHVTDSYKGSGTQPKYHKSGNFKISMYLNQPSLYFKCDIAYCYSSTDTSCTNVCNKRRKREAVRPEGVAENVTSDVTVVPYMEQKHSKPGDVDGEVILTTTIEDCLSNSDIRTMLGFMAALTAVSIATAICFCLLFRQRRNRDKREHNELKRTWNQKHRCAS